MQQNIKCPHCGTENIAGSKTCSACRGELSNMLATTATFIEAPQKLKEGPQIDVGGLRAGEKAVLVIKKGPVLGQRLTVKEGETVIGRDPKADIFLNDITVSRRHAKIMLADGKATAKDLGSLNGTYLNNERFSEAALNNQDELQIGKYVLVFLSR